MSRRFRFPMLLLLSGFVLLYSMAVAQPPAGKSKSKTSEKKAAAQLAAQKAAKAGLAEMIRKLEQGEYLEFIHQHSPADEYVAALRRGEAERISFRAIAELGSLSLRLKTMLDIEPQMDAGGRIAQFRNVSVVEVPAVLNPYSETPVTGDGYGNDLKKVIAAAIRDLEAGEYERFMQNMFPPSTISMMKADDRWDGIVSSLTKDSPMVDRMLEDLKSIRSENATVDGTTATYRFANDVVPADRQDDDRGEAEKSLEVGMREIRFSKIGNSWRFFDATVGVPGELDKALAREPAGETLSSDIVLEKVGSDWRLSSMVRPE